MVTIIERLGLLYENKNNNRLLGMTRLPVSMHVMPGSIMPVMKGCNVCNYNHSMTK